MDLETLSVNAIGTVREETLNGRSYLVAPVTMIVPGVLPGSRGPLFYPEDEVARNPGMWNEIPITVGHPVLNGQNVSARDPQVAAKFTIGKLYRDKVTANGARQAEAWFDKELTQQKAPQLLTNLKSGVPTEQSTGLFTSNLPVQNGEQFYKGRRYTHVARNYRPDHLAVLLDQKGACSVQDGCGVLVNEQTETTENSGKVNNPEGCNQYKPCQTTRKTDKGINVGSLGSPEEAQKFAEQHPGVTFFAQENGYGKVIGYAIQAPDEASRVAVTKALYAHKTKKKPTTNTEVPVALTANQRTEILTGLTVNCKCEEDRKILANFSDDMLITMRDQTQVVNTVKSHLGVEELTVNAATEALPPKTKTPPATTTKKTKKPGCEDEEEMTTTNKTMQEWLAEAPPEAQEFIQNGVQQTKDTHGLLVNHLTAHLPEGDAKTRAKAFYSGKTLNELKELASFQPAAPVVTNSVGIPVNKRQQTYLGANGPIPITTNAGQQPPVDISKEDDDFAPPVLNWSELAGAK